MARGSVLVSPAIFPASMEVAPNSPRPLAKAKIAPLSTPGMAFGMITAQKILLSPRPSVRAAWIRF